MPQPFADLTVATTIHNNLERWMEMARSLEEEAALPFEIVVVDDGSAVPAVIEGLKSPVRLLRNETPRGFCAASDQALRAVTTPCALLLDADITFLPGDFAAAYASFQSLPRLAWSNFRQVSATGKEGSSSDAIIVPPAIYALGSQIAQRWLSRRAPSLPPASLNERVRSVLIAHSSSALVRMEAFREINGFDLRYWQCQSDIDICLRLGQAGWQVGIDPAYTVRHDGIGGRTGGVKRVYDLYYGCLLVYETHFPSSRFYLRPLLGLRHLAEALIASLRPWRPEEHLRAGFRLRLAYRALRGYPR